jgi:uncharacterized protein with ATP-grasp and redox domains
MLRYRKPENLGNCVFIKEQMYCKQFTATSSPYKILKRKVNHRKASLLQTIHRNQLTADLKKGNLPQRSS